jgi:hypothetical protein
VKLAQIAPALRISAQEGGCGLPPLPDRAAGQPAFITHPEDEVLEIIIERN